MIQYNYIGGEPMKKQPIDNKTAAIQDTVLSQTHEFLRAMATGGNSFYGVNIGNTNVS